MKDIFGLATVIYLVAAAPAYAYIDPVSASFILQAIVGGFAAAMVAIKRVRVKILSLFGLAKADDAEDADLDENKSEQ